MSATHVHKKSRDLPDCEVCSCGRVRYPSKRWLLGEPKPSWLPWERPLLGLVRIPNYPHQE